ncbi:MAG: hypothetical protein CMJ19_03420 [Phycisphaeraceae bacterium]|nr:hypothetical protein [Phycisphaeraceae bacterium]
MSPWLQQQKALLLQDKKKLGLIVGLACVMLLLWGRLILKQVPRTAVATPAATAAATPSSTPSTDALRRKVVNPDKPIVEVDIPPVSQRDLFAVNLSEYPMQEEPEAKQEVSDTIKNDQPQPDAVEEQLQTMVGRIRLQSTVMGARPAAVINGRIVQVGQTFEGLVLKEVRNRQVILEFNGRLVSLRMN